MKDDGEEEHIIESIILEQVPYDEADPDTEYGTLEVPFGVEEISVNGNDGGVHAHEMIDAIPSPEELSKPWNSKGSA